MIRLTLAQMSRGLVRLTAAGIAVVIGTAFLTASLLAMGTVRDVTTGALTASYGQADLVAESNGSLSEEQMSRLRAIPGVAAADPQAMAYGVVLSHANATVSQSVIAVPTLQQSQSQVLTDGVWPSADGQIALPAQTAERLKVDVGDQTVVRYDAWTQAADAPDESEPTAVQVEQTVTVVGVTEDPNSAWSSYGGAAEATLHDVLLWMTATDLSAGGEPSLSLSGVSQATVVLRDGADPEQVRTDIMSVLEQTADQYAPPGVYTRQEAAENAISSGSGSGPITVFILCFAAVALLVTGLVIANTFQVLVAQRIQTLALLRCVGASRRQIRRSVLVEAAVLGLTGSIGGVVVGFGLVQVMLWVLGRTTLPFPVPDTVQPTAIAVAVPLAVGVLVTVAAAFTPARVATRVAPIAALRPLDAPVARNRGGRFRLAVSLLLVSGGGAMLIAGTVAATRGDLVWAALAVFGGGMSFVGLLIGAIFWMPRVIAMIGAALGRLSMPARLAAANTGRHPARTAATSTALLIGVTLVSMMTVGALSARRTIDSELDQKFPVDVTVGMSAEAAGSQGISFIPLPADAVGRYADLAGVSAAVGLASEQLALATGDGEEMTINTVAIDSATAAELIRDPETAGQIDADAVVLPDQLDYLGTLADGDTVTLRLNGQSVTRTVRLTDWSINTALVSTATAVQLGFTDQVSTAWLRLDSLNDAGDTMQTIREVYPDVALPMNGAAANRSVYQRAIDTVLAVVVGLLAVAVVIALIGVTNTLSLSVIERRRESATLRALGLTRRQLRVSLAAEGALIAGVGALAGIVLGLLYGWAGTLCLLSANGTVRLAVPWTQLAAVLAVAWAAGVLASVLPARSASRIPLVAALAEA